MARHDPGVHLRRTSLRVDGAPGTPRRRRRCLGAGSGHARSHRRRDVAIRASSVPRCGRRRPTIGRGLGDPSIRLAQHLRRQRDRLNGFVMINSVTGAVMRLLDAVAWPGENYIMIGLPSDHGPRQLTLTADDSVTDGDVLRKLRRAGPATCL